jgi:hypothetical protein
MRRFSTNGLHCKPEAVCCFSRASQEIIIAVVQCKSLCASWQLLQARIIKHFHGTTAILAMLFSVTTILVSDPSPSESWSSLRNHMRIAKSAHRIKG